MAQSGNIVVELPGKARSHRGLLKSLQEETTGEVRVASAYVTDPSLLLAAKGRKRKLLISLEPMDVASGATSLECLRALLQSSVEIRYSTGQPRLHAKAYLFGGDNAVITSANMTLNAMQNNLEVGSWISGDDVQVLVKWFEDLWQDSEQLTIDILADLSDKLKKQRRLFLKLENEVSKSLKVPREKSVKVQSNLSTILYEDRKFYLVNTNRRYDKRTKTGGYRLEQSMLEQGLSVVWESFRKRKDMSEVRAGDVILAFAKKVGIIAVGVAQGKLDIIQGESEARIRAFSEHPYAEWRIPTQWIVRVDDEDALPYPEARNVSFIDVSGAKFSYLKDAVKERFAG